MTVAPTDRGQHNAGKPTDPGKLRPVGDGDALPPSSIEAEEQVIGSVLHLGTIPDGVTLAPDDFYRPAHRTIWQAIQARHGAEQPITPALVVIDLARGGVLDDLGGQDVLIHLWEHADAPSHAAVYAAEVARTAQERHVYDLGHRLSAFLARAGAHPTPGQMAYVADLANQIAALAGAPTGPTAEAPVELDAFLAEPDPEYDWLIEGLIERGDRLILTGGEGGGKSTLLRQLSVQGSSGIHPFDPGREVPPIRVLIVDVENSRSQIRREIRPLRLAAKDRYEPGRLHLVPHPQGLDLYECPEDVAWLEQQIIATSPDLLIIGPLYKLASGDPTEERVARAVAAVLDRLRTVHGFALIVEAHTPHATGGNKRPTRPYGASLWLRWPEFGIHIEGQSGMLTHWRGQREERDWPTILQKGGAWPWTCRTSPREDVWGRIIDFTIRKQKVLPQREMADALNVAKGTVQRAIDEHRVEWNGLCADIESLAAEVSS